jgi:hypothetical protein
MISIYQLNLTKLQDYVPMTSTVIVVHALRRNQLILDALSSLATTLDLMATV